jgi:sec-independent protein translocase protein TatA
MPGGMELAAIIAVVVLLFGGKKIPELAKGLGKGIKDFKNAVKDDETVADAKDAVKEIKDDAKETVTEVKEATKQA